MTEFSFNCVLDLPNQRVIKYDSERTRSTHLDLHEKRMLELLLTYYCKDKNISYKQGLNEVLAPFLLLTRQGLTLCETYKCFQGFVCKTFGSMFTDRNFEWLQGQMALYTCLLQYFDPRLSEFLFSSDLGPEVYLSPWLVTAFASKTSDLGTLYLFWTRLLTETAPDFIVFVCVALFNSHRNRILASGQSLLGETMTQLELTSKYELKRLLCQATTLRNNLPYTMRMRLVLPSFTLESPQYLEVLPAEIVHRCYPFNHKCLCKKQGCKWCGLPMKLVPLVILDCRTSKERRCGLMPNSVLLKLDTIKTESDLIEVTKMFEESKGSFHLALLGNCDSERGKEVTQAVHMAFLTREFPLVSRVKGGYTQCHDLALSLGFDLEKHRSERCRLCTPQTVPRKLGFFKAGFVNRMKHRLGLGHKKYANENVQVYYNLITGSSVVFAEVGGGTELGTDSLQFQIAHAFFVREF